MWENDTRMSRNHLTYAEAGVDIAAGNALVEAIKPLARATARPGAGADLGGFGALFDLKAAGFADPVLVAATDGVGTKLKIAIAAQTFDTVGIDLVAMCVNDLVVQGAEPLFFLDYFAAGRLDVAMAEAVVGGIAAGCRQAGCALIGGESAEMPGLYQTGDFDLAGFAVGAVERGEILTGETVAAGDLVLGLASSGLHSNGYSLVRKIVDDLALDYAAPAPFAAEQTLAEALLAPTRIYVKSGLAALRLDAPAARPVKALAHITGGGFVENLPRVLPAGLAARIDAAAWPRPPVFAWLSRAGGVPPAEMMRTFNCGIGMAVVVAPDRRDEVTAALEAHGECVHVIGEIIARSDEMPAVVLDNLEAT